MLHHDWYPTFFLDSITQLSRQCFAWCKTQPGAVSDRTGKPDMRGAYGLLGQEMIGALTHLQHARGKNVVFVAILDERLDDYNRKVFVPQIEGSKTSLELPGIVDEVVTLAEIKAEDGSAYRAFVTHTVNPYGFPAKDRSGRLEPARAAEPAHADCQVCGHTRRARHHRISRTPRISGVITMNQQSTSSNWNDFNDAESQQSGFDLIPKGTAVPVRMTLKPGGYDDPSQGWGGGYATGDLTQVNYSSIRAGLLEFRRRCEAIQHNVIVHQLCRPIWRAWMEQALLEGALALPQFTQKKRDYLAAKWIPQGWQWVDPKKEFDAMLTAIRAGLLSRSEAISAFGYDAEDIDREIAADNQRADELGLVFDSDPRHDKQPIAADLKPPDDPDITNA